MIENCVKIGIQRSVNGYRGKVDAREMTVITYMLLLLVMMNNEIRLTKVSHVQDAKTVTMTFLVSYSIE